MNLSDSYQNFLIITFQDISEIYKRAQIMIS